MKTTNQVITAHLTNAINGLAQIAATQPDQTQEALNGIQRITGFMGTLNGGTNSNSPVIQPSGGAITKKRGGRPAGSVNKPKLPQIQTVANPVEPIIQTAPVVAETAPQQAETTNPTQPQQQN